MLLHAYLLHACFTGMRTGEVCALTWDDINFEDKTITINNICQQIIKKQSNRVVKSNSKRDKGNAIICT